MNARTYTVHNEDNIVTAIDGLSKFMHNFCMNCVETEARNDLIFRCDECEFGCEDGKCLIKVFTNNHLPDGREIPRDFDCMSR